MDDPDDGTAASEEPLISLAAEFERDSKRLEIGPLERSLGYALRHKKRAAFERLCSRLGVAAPPIGSGFLEEELAWASIGRILAEKEPELSGRRRGRKAKNITDDERLCLFIDEVKRFLRPMAPQEYEKQAILAENTVLDVLIEMHESGFVQYNRRYSDVSIVAWLQASRFWALVSPSGKKGRQASQVVDAGELARRISIARRRFKPLS